VPKSAKKKKRLRREEAQFKDDGIRLKVCRRVDVARWLGIAHGICRSGAVRAGARKSEIIIAFGRPPLSQSHNDNGNTSKENRSSDTNDNTDNGILLLGGKTFRVLRVTILLRQLWRAGWCRKLG